MFLFYNDRIEITCKNQSNFQTTVVLKITFGQFLRSLMEAYSTVERRVKLTKKCRSIAKSSLLLLIILD